MTKDYIFWINKSCNIKDSLDNIVFWRNALDVPNVLLPVLLHLQLEVVHHGLVLLVVDVVGNIQAEKTTSNKSKAKKKDIRSSRFLYDGAPSHGEDPQDAEEDADVVEDDAELARLRPLLWVQSSWCVVDSGRGGGGGGLLGVPVGGKGLQRSL